MGVTEAEVLSAQARHLLFLVEKCYDLKNIFSAVYQL